MNENNITFSSLDPSQKNTFNSIDNDSATIQIVYGPPGTGKSQLVVSLLERLAGENKKVLFVSQNTEALRVIERMIKHTESTIGYPNDNKYLSLLDFCLMLHNPTHRYLKYLREQYSKITSKQLPDIFLVDKPLAIKYPLRYTTLDHNSNYHITSDDIGFDELVGYYIKYVRRSMAPESVREFEKVNVRAVFAELDSYEHKDYFTEFNKPRRELILLSTKNSNIVLPDIREQIKNINDVFHGDYLNRFATKTSIDVVDYLILLQKYNQSIQYVDIYRIATEHKKVGELTKSLKDFIDSTHENNEKLQRIDKHIASVAESAKYQISIPDDLNEQIKLSAEAITIAERDFSELLQDHKHIPELVKVVLGMAPDVKYSSLSNLLTGMAKQIKSVLSETIEGGQDTVYLLTSKDIDVLNRELDKYYTQNAIKRMLSGVPKSFKDLLAFENAKQMDAYRESFAPILNAIKEIIDIDGSSIKQFIGLANKNSTIELSKLGVKPSKDITVLKDRLLPVYELFYIINKKYGSASITGEFKEVSGWFSEFSRSVKALDLLRQDSNNKKAFLAGKLTDFLTDANQAIDIKHHQQKKSEVLNEQKVITQNSFSENSKWLIGINETDSYAARAREVYEYLDRNEAVIGKVIDTLSLPDDNASINSDIEKLVTTINEINQLDLFSDFFFELPQEKTLQDWLGSINILSTYNNDSEIVDFIQHNKSIGNIRQALGVANSQYLDEILSNDITFDVFASRLVNVLVGESFGRAGLNDKKHVTTKDIVDSYEKYLKSQKAQTYKDNLKHIYSSSLDAMRELSKQSTMQLGGKSTMDKFRYNTATIASAFPIICATPKEVSKYIAPDKGIFDFVIFDEASQLLPGQALPSIYRAKKAVIIGDPHQMPPSLNASIGLTEQSEDDFDDLGESILDLVRKQAHKMHHLKVHYRSKYNKLFEPSLEAIYNEDGIKPIFEAGLANGAPIDIIDDLGDDQDEFGYDKNFYKICESVDEYLAQDSDSSFCILFTGVIKLNEFKNFLAQIGEQKYQNISRLYGTDKILLSTVTNCQGIEGTYTIIYMQHYQAPGMMWFFKETAGAYKRLNVSITRQREGLKLLLADQKSRWVQTCEDKINSDSTGPNTRKSAELMKALLQNAGEVTDTTYLDRKLGNNVNLFDSPLTQQLYEKLTEHYADQLGRSIKIYSEVGWHLLIPTGEGIDANERNVGFRIDLGVFSTKHKKFVLGIEMDGAMYHSGFDKEQSDYNRQKVLEQKGWELYRIWSTNWLDDTDREFSRLTQFIDKSIAV